MTTKTEKPRSYCNKNRKTDLKNSQNRKTENPLIKHLPRQRNEKTLSQEPITPGRCFKKRYAPSTLSNWNIRWPVLHDCLPRSDVAPIKIS